MALIIFLALLSGVSASAAQDVGLGDTKIHPKPYPAPVLPRAGGAFTDPTFGTKIVRVTDPSNAPKGASVNSAAQDSMFNADGSMFYLHVIGSDGYSEAVLYSLERASGHLKRLGALPTSQGLTYDGARWDPTNPSLLYAIVMSAVTRELWQLTLPAGRATKLHDFSQEIPRGGYPYSRVQVSADSRYFAITASSGALGEGQDAFDYVVVWDRKTGATRTLNTMKRFGAPLHSMELDNSGEYAILEAATNNNSWVWHWPDDGLSVPLGIGLPFAFGGHKALGNRVVVGSGPDAGEWVIRALARPETFSEILRFPPKNGKRNWFEDSHSTRLVAGDRYFQSRYVPGFGWGRFVRHASSIYKMSRYRANSADFDAPEVVRYKGVELQRVPTMPSRAGEWTYVVASDTLYVWLPDNSDPEKDRNALAICDWRPLMEEIIEFVKVGDAWTWRRLAHHRMHQTGVWSASPRGNADPTGSYVLFQSNWDGSPRIDVFLLFVPKGPASVAAPRKPAP